MNAPLEMQTQPPVLRDDAGGIVTLTLNRAAQFNAINGALLDAMQAALDAVAGDASARVVVIAGAGRAFCPGHDLKEMLANSNEAFIGDLFRRCCDVMRTIERLPQPVLPRCTASPRPPDASSSPPATWPSPRPTRASRPPASISVCSARRPACRFRATLAQAGVRNADDGRVHRRADCAELGPREPRRRGRTRSTPRPCAGAALLAKPRARGRRRQALLLPPARAALGRGYAMASGAITRNMLGPDAQEGVPHSSRSASRAGVIKDETAPRTTTRAPPGRGRIVGAATIS